MYDYNIGLVYDNSCCKAQELKKIVDYLNDNTGSVMYSKVSLDVDGDEWVESHFSEIDYTMLVNNFYGEIQLICKKLFDTNDISLTIYIQSEETYFGFVLSFEFKNEKKLLLIDKLEEEFINLVLEFYRCSKFNYAFCDHDSEIEIYPMKKEEINQLYSIVIWPNNKKDLSKIVKNNWKIDGITPRL